MGFKEDMKFEDVDIESRQEELDYKGVLTRQLNRIMQLITVSGNDPDVLSSLDSAIKGLRAILPVDMIYMKTLNKGYKALELAGKKDFLTTRLFELKCLMSLMRRNNLLIGYDVAGT